MKKIRILFYVTPKFKWKYLVNWAISIWTRSKYSHCEVWVGDESGKFIFTKFEAGDYTATSTFYGSITGTIRLPRDVIEILGLCYTSTMRGEANGTVKRDASGVLDKPEHWEYMEVEVEDDMYDYMIWWMNDEVEGNMGYAMYDLLKFISPIHFPDNTRNICSEFVNDTLCGGEVLKGFGIISPKKLHKKLKKKGYETKKLA